MVSKTYEGSVKDVYKIEKDGKSFLLFYFTDNFSVFDWGRMPDTIFERGINLKNFAEFFYKKITDPASWLGTKYEKSGFPTLYTPIEKLELKDKLNLDLNRIITLKQADVIPPDYIKNEFIDIPDYSANKNKINRMIPLEIIFRFGVPKGSSLIKRGYKEGQEFEKPLIEFSTKYEEMDRMLSDELAFNISGLDAEKFAILKELTNDLALYLKKSFQDIEIKLWDGKFEFALNENGEISLADAITPDELRLTINGEIYSKEFLRQFYVNTVWYKKLLEAKEKAAKSGIKDFKEIFNETPPKLDEKTINMAADLYENLTDKLCHNKQC